MKIGEQEVAKLESYLQSYGNSRTYNALTSNCADPIESGLEELGYPIGMALTPMDLKDSLIWNKIIDGNTYTLYQAELESPYPKAPWTVLFDF